MPHKHSLNADVVLARLLNDEYAALLKQRGYLGKAFAPFRTVVKHSAHENGVERLRRQVRVSYVGDEDFGLEVTGSGAVDRGLPSSVRRDDKIGANG